MLIVQQKSIDPYFNIATEEYFLKNFSEDIFILYRNEPSVIVGKHQNTLAEINLPFIQKKGLKVVRRLSGGGTVYHDLGNLNYTFIANGSEGNLVDFKKFTQPIIDVLKRLGINAQIGGKNDIRISDKKISGNAEHIYKNRVLHHGTLLFSSQLDELNESIKVNPKTYTDKAVKSIRSTVTNISEFLKEPITIEGFAKLIEDHIKRFHANSDFYNFTSTDFELINKLVKEKYSTWEWNFGYSPTYKLSKEIKVGKDLIKFTIQVDKGIITDIHFEGLLKHQKELDSLLIGCPHEYYEILARLSVIDLDIISKEELINGLF